MPVDAFAIGAVQALTEKGLKVPQDVKVVTRLEEVAAQAIELLFEQINGAGIDQRQRIDAPVATLVVRESSAALPPAGDPR